MATAAINPNTPFGLQPMRRLDGAKWGDSGRVYFIPANTSTAFYVGDPVVKLTGSADVNGVNGLALATAGTTNKVTGAVIGILGSATAGSGNTPSMYGMTPGPAYVPASSALDWYVIVNDDPETQYVIQADANYGSSSGTAMPVTVIGKNAVLKSGTGSAFTGLSGWLLDSSAPATTVGFQLNIIGFQTDAKNAAVAQYQKVIVRLNTSTETNLQVGI